MNISKRAREQAALICAIAASNPDLTCSYDDVRISLGLPTHNHADRVWGKTLDSAAWRFVCRHSHGQTNAEVDAEAEALIRTGWSP